MNIAAYNAMLISPIASKEKASIKYIFLYRCSLYHYDQYLF